MQEPQAKNSAIGQASGELARRRSGEYALFHCLVASTEPMCRARFAEAAAESGWEPIVCDDATTALDSLSRMFVQLAIVDVEHDADGEFTQLLEEAQAAGTLLVVCGADNDMQEEVLIRQLGAWLYLPGVTESTDMTLLCAEARHLVERLHAAANGSTQRQRAARRGR